MDEYPEYDFYNSGEECDGKREEGRGGEKGGAGGRAGEGRRGGKKEGTLKEKRNNS